MKGDPLTCRVLTPCTINGQTCAVGDRVELAEPQRGFLIEHRQVALVDWGKRAKKKRGEVESGASV